MSGEERMEAYEEKLRAKPTIPTTHISGSGKVHIDGIGEVRVAGAGFVSPEEIDISGSARLPGGIRVKKVKCSGSISVEGDIEAEDMVFAGSADVEGNIKAGILSAAGSFSTHGEVKASVMKSAGSSRVGNGIDVDDTLRSAGALKVMGDVKAKNLVDLRGTFDVDGGIATDRFEARLSRHESHVRGGIRARDVNMIRRESEGLVILGIPILRRFFREGKLYTTGIMAEEKIYLENVSCDDVQGRDVTIGQGCNVRRKVTYSESISVHPTSTLATPPEKQASARSEK
jgi:cytoskeletal protein CcmA (bactofilin family)